MLKIAHYIENSLKKFKKHIFYFLVLYILVSLLGSILSQTFELKDFLMQIAFISGGWLLTYVIFIIIRDCIYKIYKTN